MVSSCPPTAPGGSNCSSSSSRRQSPSSSSSSSTTASSHSHSSSSVSSSSHNANPSSARASSSQKSPSAVGTGTNGGGGGGQPDVHQPSSKSSSHSPSSSSHQHYHPNSRGDPSSPSSSSYPSSHPHSSAPSSSSSSTPPSAPPAPSGGTPSSSSPPLKSSSPPGGGHVLLTLVDRMKAVENQGLQLRDRTEEIHVKIQELQTQTVRQAMILKLLQELISFLLYRLGKFDVIVPHLPFLIRFSDKAKRISTREGRSHREAGDLLGSEGLTSSRLSEEASNNGAFHGGGGGDRRKEKKDEKEETKKREIIARARMKRGEEHGTSRGRAGAYHHEEECIIDLLSPEEEAVEEENLLLLPGGERCCSSSSFSRSFSSSLSSLSLSCLHPDDLTKDDKRRASSFDHDHHNATCSSSSFFFSRGTKESKEGEMSSTSLQSGKPKEEGEEERKSSFSSSSLRHLCEDLHTAKESHLSGRGRGGVIRYRKCCRRDSPHDFPKGKQHQSPLLFQRGWNKRRGDHQSGPLKNNSRRSFSNLRRQLISHEEERSHYYCCILQSLSLGKEEEEEEEEEDQEEVDLRRRRRRRRKLGYHEKERDDEHRKREERRRSDDVFSSASERKDDRFSQGLSLATIIDGLKQRSYGVCISVLNTFLSSTFDAADILTTSLRDVPSSIISSLSFFSSPSSLETKIHPSIFSQSSSFSASAKDEKDVKTKLRTEDSKKIEGVSLFICNGLADMNMKLLGVLVLIPETFFLLFLHMLTRSFAFLESVGGRSLEVLSSIIFLRETEGEGSSSYISFLGLVVFLFLLLLLFHIVTAGLVARMLFRKARSAEVVACEAIRECQKLQSSLDLLVKQISRRPSYQDEREIYSREEERDGGEEEDDEERGRRRRRSPSCSEETEGRRKRSRSDSSPSGDLRTDREERGGVLIGDVDGEVREHTFNEKDEARDNAEEMSQALGENVKEEEEEEEGGDEEEEEKKKEEENGRFGTSSLLGGKKEGKREREEGRWSERKMKEEEEQKYRDDIASYNPSKKREERQRSREFMKGSERMDTFRVIPGSRESQHLQQVSSEERLQSVQRDEEDEDEEGMSFLSADLLEKKERRRKCHPINVEVLPLPQSVDISHGLIVVDPQVDAPPREEEEEKDEEKKHRLSFSASSRDKSRFSSSSLSSPRENHSSSNKDSLRLAATTNPQEILFLERKYLPPSSDLVMVSGEPSGVSLLMREDDNGLSIQDRGKTSRSRGRRGLEAAVYEKDEENKKTRGEREDRDLLDYLHRRGLSSSGTRDEREEIPKQDVSRRAVVVVEEEQRQREKESLSSFERDRTLLVDLQGERYLLQRETSHEHFPSQTHESEGVRRLSSYDGSSSCSDVHEVATNISKERKEMKPLSKRSDDSGWVRFVANDAINERSLQHYVGRSSPLSHPSSTPLSLTNERPSEKEEEDSEMKKKKREKMITIGRSEHCWEDHLHRDRSRVEDFNSEEHLHCPTRSGREMGASSSSPAMEDHKEISSSVLPVHRRLLGERHIDTRQEMEGGADPSLSRQEGKPLDGPSSLISEVDPIATLSRQEGDRPSSLIDKETVSPSRHPVKDSPSHEHLQEEGNEEDLSCSSTPFSSSSIDTRRHQESVLSVVPLGRPSLPPISLTPQPPRSSKVSHHRRRASQAAGGLNSSSSSHSSSSTNSSINNTGSSSSSGNNNSGSTSNRRALKLQRHTVRGERAGRGANHQGKQQKTFAEQNGRGGSRTKKN
ncbi:sad1 unc family c-terminal protein [Cystoisospora suis]|uniref:Sad1 unc family c-terminal protein n=1 Tax=Cystoisospora suis TaxID=483139 RepID=A0A2C6KXV5_9APIC|nr:sad1 unc family c-terminal protein [Cystoisospora suis]